MAQGLQQARPTSRGRNEKGARHAGLGRLAHYAALPYGKGIHAINNTVASALRGQPGTAFINTEPVLADPSGAFQSSGVVNGVVQTLRSGDGIHMSSVGENVVATFVDQQLALLLHTSLVPAAVALLRS